MELTTTTHVCAEVQYETDAGNTHSDICGDPSNPEWRAFLHANLDEWLDRGAGSGWFIVGAAAYNEDYETDILDRVAVLTNAGFSATA